MIVYLRLTWENFLNSSNKRCTIVSRVLVVKQTAQKSNRPGGLCLHTPPPFDQDPAKITLANYMIHGELLAGKHLPERSVPDLWILVPQISQCLFWLFGLTITSTFDLLTYKSYQSIFVPNCNLIVNLVILSQVVSIYDHTQTLAQLKKQNAFSS